jgi:hypothetical protein
LEWDDLYNGTGNSWDTALDLALDSAGNAYVTGVSEGNGTDNDIVTIKYDSSGNRTWTSLTDGVARYNGPGNDRDYGKAITFDTSGNVYVTGGSFTSGTDYDFITIKYRESGVLDWIVRHNGSANGSDVSEDIVIDSSGNIYITGYSNRTGTKTDFITKKIKR